MINSFILSNFNSCPLVWFITSSKSLNKIENLHKRALRFLFDDYQSSYDQLLVRSGKPSLNVRNYRNLYIEIYKTINNLNPTFMNEIFRLRLTNRPIREKYKLNLEIPEINQVRFGTKSLRYLGPWNMEFFTVSYQIFRKPYQI